MVSFPFLLRSRKYKVWHRYCQSIYCFDAICRAEFCLLDCSYFPVTLFLFLLIIIIMMVIIIIIILFFCFSVKPKMELFLDYLWKKCEHHSKTISRNDRYNCLLQLLQKLREVEFGEGVCMTFWMSKSIRINLEAVVHKCSSK